MFLSMENKIIKNASSVFSGRKMVGIYLFFGQRLYFGHMTKNYSDKLHVNTDKCIVCGKCEKLCPMKNIKLVNKRILQNNQYTMCYRCINNCPKQAITLLGKSVVEQSLIEKYLE